MKTNQTNQENQTIEEKVNDSRGPGFEDKIMTAFGTAMDWLGKSYGLYKEYSELLNAYSVLPIPVEKGERDRYMGTFAKIDTVRENIVDLISLQASTATSYLAKVVAAYQFLGDDENVRDVELSESTVEFYKKANPLLKATAAAYETLVQLKGDYVQRLQISGGKDKSVN